MSCEKREIIITPHADGGWAILVRYEDGKVGTVYKPYLSEVLRVVHKVLKRWKKQDGKPVSKT